MVDYYGQMIQDWRSLQQALQSGDFDDAYPGNFRLPGYTIKPNSEFFQLTPDSGARSSDWKFHLSVDEKDIPDAWNIVVEELAKDGNLHVAKVVKPDTAVQYSNPDSIQAGKIITIYDTNNYSPEEYQNVLARIEERMSAAGITPGPLTNADRSIPGSHYMSYRRGTTPDGTPMPSSNFSHLPQEQRFNPYNSSDPYARIDFSHLHTPNAHASLDAQTSNHFDPLETIATGEWKEARASDGTSITRITRLAVNDLTPDQIDQTINTLNEQGFHPQIHNSDTLGKTIRLSGHEVEHFNTLQNSGAFKNTQTSNQFDPLEAIATGEWQEARASDGASITRITRIAVNDLSSDQVDQIINTLNEQGFHPQIHDSDTLGKTIRLSGHEVEEFKKLQNSGAFKNSSTTTQNTPYGTTDAAEQAVEEISVQVAENVTEQAATEAMEEITEEVAEEVTEQVAEVTEAAAKNHLTVNASEIEMPGKGSLLGKAKGILGKWGKNSGFIGGIAIGTIVGGITLATTGNMAEAAEATFETAVPYGETVLDVGAGDMGAAAQSATVETMSNVGGLGGAASGTLLGASLGSAIPIVGTTVGAIAGGIIGGVGGGVVIGEATDYIIDHSKEITHTAMTKIKNAGATISNAATTTKDFVAEKTTNAWKKITGLFNDEAAQKEMIAQAPNFSGEDATYSGDTSLAKEAVKNGININTTLITEKSVEKLPAPGVQIG